MLSTKKISDGLYAVVKGGKVTKILIQRGDPPKYRMPQDWYVGVDHGTHVSWLTYDQRGKREALHLVEAIWSELE